VTAAPPALAIEGLTVAVGPRSRPRAVVEDLSLAVARGETVCLAGESGSGKSMTALAVMGLLPRAARVVAGRVTVGGTDLTGLDEAALRRVRGDRVAMIFQEPMTSLNPVLTVGRQLTEAIRAHRPVGGGEARRLAKAALDAVRIPEAERRLRQYPHELSGGMRQRVMIAMALALRPEVLIADEPTTALDVTVQREVLELLRDLQRELGMGLLLITHDMGVVAEMADRVAVMRNGRLVEEAAVGPLFATPKADYTRALLAAVPRFAPRPPRPVAPAPAVVEAVGLTVGFDLASGFLDRAPRRVYAVEGVSFFVRPGETLALVGESGCGKSTIAKALAGLVPYEGDIVIGGQNVAGLDRGSQRRARREVQLVFQDPYASLDPRMTVGALVAEPMVIHGLGGRSERSDRVAELFEKVGLSPDHVGRYPHEFSGGQRQRISIARALALRPKLIIADESVSALDVSVQARVLELLKSLQDEFGISYLFISHDMAVVSAVADRVAVMRLGQIVETGPASAVFSAPQHAYTRTLIDAVPLPDPQRRRIGGARLAGAVPSPVRRRGDPPARVSLTDIGDGHLVATEAGLDAAA
jgi:peptide/nickel transport system ATP-binding protein